MMSVLPLTLSGIAHSYHGRITRQSYQNPSRIDGVQILDLKHFADDGGGFVELGRLDETAALLALPSFRVQQVNFSELVSGAVKAWHLHLDQDDLWFVPSGQRLLVGLKDLRAQSPTCNQEMRFTLGAGQTQLLLIPHGVAHGAANPWNTSTFMFYFVNHHFSATNADEHRLAWDAFGGEFWCIHKG